MSAAGLVCLKPGSRGHLFYRVRIHRGRKGGRRSMSEADYAELVTAAHRELNAPVILIWDNLNTHVSAVMRALTGARRDWLTVIQLPGLCAAPQRPCRSPCQGLGDTPSSDSSITRRLHPGRASAATRPARPAEAGPHC